MHRPRSEFTKEEIKKRSQVIINNKTTNHWGTKIFQTYRGLKINYHTKIQSLIDNPTKVYDIVPLHTATSRQRSLAGID